MLDQFSPKVRPNKGYKTDRPDLCGAGFDIHSAIGKLLAPKRGWMRLYGPANKAKYPNSFKTLSINLEFSDLLQEVFSIPYNVAGLFNKTY